MSSASAGRGGKRAAGNKKQAIAAWRKHIASSSKASIDEFPNAHPEKHLEVQHFIAFKMWEGDDQGEDIVPRCCRGRTTIERIPPTFLVNMFFELSDCTATKEQWWVLNKQTDQLLAAWRSSPSCWP